MGATNSLFIRSVMAAGRAQAAADRKAAAAAAGTAATPAGQAAGTVQAATVSATSPISGAIDVSGSGTSIDDRLKKRKTGAVFDTASEDQTSSTIRV